MSPGEVAPLPPTSASPASRIPVVASVGSTRVASNRRPPPAPRARRRRARARSRQGWRIDPQCPLICFLSAPVIGFRSSSLHSNRQRIHHQVCICTLNSSFYQGPARLLLIHILDANPQLYLAFWWNLHRTTNCINWKWCWANWAWYIGVALFAEHIWCLNMSTSAFMEYCGYL